MVVMFWNFKDVLQRVWPKGPFMTLAEMNLDYALFTAMLRQPDRLATRAAWN